MNIKDKKEFFRQLCRTVGHADTKPSGRCSRCQKRIAGAFGTFWGVELIGTVIHNAAGVVKINLNVDET